MVKKRWLLSGVIVLAGVSVVCWYFFFAGSDRDLVMRAMRNMTEYVNRNAGEKTSVMIMKSQRVGGLFDDTCLLLSELQMFAGEYTPEMISANFIRIRQLFTTLRMSCHDIAIAFPAEGEATADFSCHVSGSLKSGESVSEVRDVHAKLRKKSGRWVFYHIETREVLRR